MLLDRISHMRCPPNEAPAHRPTYLIDFMATLAPDRTTSPCGTRCRTAAVYAGMVRRTIGALPGPENGNSVHPSGSVVDIDQYDPGARLRACAQTGRIPDQSEEPLARLDTARKPRWTTHNLPPN